jgi:murein DD-endopeptidase MepM/ murein hydrolase activator NlpD
MELSQTRSHPGTTVQRGQYLGDTDDTGYSTSQHVHFRVTNSVWLVDDGYYWGASIDIRFAECRINNGIRAPATK